MVRLMTSLHITCKRIIFKIDHEFNESGSNYQMDIDDSNGHREESSQKEQQSQKLEITLKCDTK